MSDKLFFKGRQDARQNHIKYGYNTKSNTKLGSKKSPLMLIVTSEARKQEVELLVTDAKLFAEITIDDSDSGLESIADLTVLLETQDTVKRDEVPGRNDPCICDSGKKYKKCCG
jgi:SWIM/SEC-C metal-binding protein